MTKHTHTGHCQRCGALQAVTEKAAKLAHHGYQVAGFGYFAGACQAGRQLPIEMSRTIADQTIVALVDYSGAECARLAGLVDGSIVPGLVEFGYQKDAKGFTLKDSKGYSIPALVEWSTLSKVDQRKTLDGVKNDCRANIKHADAHVEMLRKLIADFHGKALIPAEDKTPAAATIKPGDTFKKYGHTWTVKTIEEKISRGWSSRYVKVAYCTRPGLGTVAEFRPQDVRKYMAEG